MTNKVWGMTFTQYGQLAKSVLLTSLMHPNLQTLTMADALMPQLVQLVLYTSQV